MNASGNATMPDFWNLLKEDGQYFGDESSDVTFAKHHILSIFINENLFTTTDLATSI